MINKYATYLKEVHRLPERMIPHYLRWVKDAYAHSKTLPKKPIAENAKDEYLNHCANRYEDWQVEQANDSIQLYTYFLSIAADTPSVPSTAESRP